MPAPDQSSITVYESGPYSPWVTQGPDGLSYHLPVDSALATFVVEFPIRQMDLDVLSSDPMRAALLYGALHHPFQLPETRLSEDDVRRYLDIILHAQLADVAAFLNPKNAASQNAIYFLAGSFATLPSDFH